MSNYKPETPLKISDVVKSIGKGDYLLPAIQRNFVWDEERIIRLFDSIMRNYPINTLMIWQLKGDTKNHYKFKLYSFIQNYCRHYDESNPLADHIYDPDDEVSVVIDGQQRLTALYIGLDGSYCGKKSAGGYPKTRNYKKFPEKELYLNVTDKLDIDASDNDLQLEYDFKFFSNEEMAKHDASAWFKVKQIGTLGDYADLGTFERSKRIKQYLHENGFSETEQSIEILDKLYETIRINEKLSYYKITNQNLHFVLDVFLRTNGGGIPLTFSELIFAMTVEDWVEGRGSIDKLVKDIKTEFDFMISRDFIMKAALTLFNTEVKFAIKNFNASVIGEIRDNWEEFETAIKAAFSLIKKLGFTDSTVRAKNAVILIVFYMYINKQYKLDNTENNLSHETIRGDITKWLSLVLITGQFGGHSDDVIRRTRDVIKNNKNLEGFPLNAIMDEFIGEAKSLSVSHERIEKIVSETQKGHVLCYPLLALLFPEYPKKFRCKDIDHMHPETSFKKESLKEIKAICENEEWYAFYSSKSNWNSLPNLQLLSDSDNRAKQGKPLDEWLKDSKKNDLDKDSMLIPKDEKDKFIVDFMRFKDFCAKRKTLLINQLEKALSGSIDDSIEEINPADDDEM